MRKIELLAPAGNLEKLKVALIYGADAVYLGGKEYSLRAMADNFSIDEISEGVKFAHKLNRKVYAAVNIFPHNEELIGMGNYLKKLQDIGIDGLLISDPGVFTIAKEFVPDMEIHISTQANNVNYMSARFWYEHGAKRIVLARELSLKEIKEIRENTPEDLELEVFVHGAMCISYSGRCLLSNYMTYRDSNRGMCAHPCRYKYYLMEEKRPGEYYKVYEDDKGSYIMNSSDLCMINHIPELIQSGVSSLKIEGRMKSSYYVATVVKAYRQAIDEYIKKTDSYKVKKEWLSELEKSSHRPFSTGFYFGKPEKQVYESSSYIRTHEICGLVTDYDEKSNIATIEQRNKIFKGDTVEILTPNRKNFEITIDNMCDSEGNAIESTPHPQMIYKVHTDKKLNKYDMLVCENNQ